MTNADLIRMAEDNDLVDLLVWNRLGWSKSVPSCDEGCEYFTNGCANTCPHDRRELAVRKWLEQEA